MSPDSSGPDHDGAAGVTRGRLFKAGGTVVLGAAGATAIAACGGGGGTTAALAAASGPSTLDKWAKSKTARLGADLTFPPLQFIDPSTKKPSGYMVEITEMMLSDLGVKPQWVQTPFAQLFAALAAGKFDMVGIAATILPTRALQGWFAGVPAYYESNVVLVKKSSNFQTTADLQSSKFAVLQGSSQQASGQVLFPKANFSAQSSESNAATEVSVGRADAAIFSEFSTGSLLQNNKDLRPLGGPPLFVDANALFMPLGDVKLYHWVTNWFRYQSAHQLFAQLWKKWVVPSAKQFHLATSLVGTDGVQVPFIS